MAAEPPLGELTSMSTRPVVELNPNVTALVPDFSDQIMVTLYTGDSVQCHL